ncbi:MAG: hypothetical protein AMXMBFR84_41290 [Candidatus Hydrogenedentota bacterium]
MRKRFSPASVLAIVLGVVVFWLSYAANRVNDSYVVGDLCELAGTLLILGGACYIVRYVATSAYTQGLFYFGTLLEVWVRSLDFAEEVFSGETIRLFDKAWPWQHHFFNVPESMALTCILLSMLMLAYELNRLRNHAIEEHHRYKALHQASLFLARVADMANQAVFGCDHKGVILTWNKGAQRLFGYEPADAVGKHIEDLFAFRPWQECGTIHEYIARHGDLKNIATALRTKNHDRVLGEASFSQVTDSRGMPAGISVVVQEVEERTRTLHELIASRNLLSRALQEVDVGLFVIARDLSVLEYNARVAIITGLSLDQIKETDLEYLQRVLLRDEVPFADRLTHHVLVLGEQVEFHNLRIYRSDDEVNVCNVAISPVFGDDGEIVAAAGVVVDITEREQLQARLFEAQKMESIGRLARGIAHDFNNLLAAVMGYAGVARMEVEPDTALSRHMAAIEESAQRAADLTHQLLAFARGGEPARKAVDLNAVIDENVSLLSSSIGQDIKVTFERSTQLDAVFGEPVQLQQILMNLCINARDAVQTGGMIKVATYMRELDLDAARERNLKKPGRYVCLSVEDNGCGMTPDVRQKIFDPFFSTKQPGKAYGLGMSVVYGIVQSHEGAIELDTEPGQGTRICIYLPSIGRTETPADSGEVTGQAAGGGNETILIVDDEDVVRSFIKEALEERGYRVLEAATGEEALLLYQSHQGDIRLIVLDIIMPGMGGIAALAELGRIDPDIRCLIASGYGVDNLDEDILQSKNVRFLSKPFKLGALTENVRSLLDG